MNAAVARAYRGHVVRSDDDGRRHRPHVARGARFFQASVVGTAVHPRVTLAADRLTLARFRRSGFSVNV